MGDEQQYDPFTGMPLPQGTTPAPGPSVASAYQMGGLAGMDQYDQAQQPTQPWYSRAANAVIDEIKQPQALERGLSNATQSVVDALTPFVPPELRGKVQGVGELADAANPVRSGQRFGMNLQQGNLPGAGLEFLGMIPGEGIAAAAGKVAPAIFAGVGAKTANLEKLAQAKQMAANAPGGEVGPLRQRIIWDETGWFQGPDKQWRFEIPDNTAQFYPQKGATPTPPQTLLEHQVQHPDLYEAYPGARNVALTELNIDDPWGRSSNVRGAYQANPPTIALNPQLSNRIGESDPFSTLLHETQHDIQRRENFAIGGNTTSPEVVAEANRISDARKAAAEQQFNDLANQRDTYVQQQIAMGRPESETTNIAQEFWDKNPALKKQFDDTFHGMFDTAGEMTRLRGDAYRRLAGEVEARNVQARRDMTPEERLARPPWETEDVPRDQQIVRMEDPVLRAARQPLPPSSLQMSMGDIADPSNYGALRQWAEPPQPSAGVMGDVARIAPDDLRVSTRFPTAVKATENPLTQQLSIGLPEMRASQGYEHNIGLLSSYPGFARLKGMAPDEAARAYIDQAAGNLQYLYDRAPQIMRDRSPLWYEGANEIATRLADRWGVPRQSASAALAALSPQKDWFMNASLAERVGDTLTSAAAGRPMTSEMRAFGRERVPEALQGDLRRIMSKRLDQLTDPVDQALWIRLYDEAHNPRAYRSISPEGTFGDYVRSQSGAPANVAWGTFGDIGKAAAALQSGGDMNVISPLLGQKHKVRSFYNNIEVPNDLRFGDVTADTHQVAAAQLRPLSGSSPAVAHNLQLSLNVADQPPGWSGSRSSALTGVQGTYGLAADATRQMAAANNMIPRAAQSATWEPVRELFTPEFKRSKGAGAVDDVWRAYDRGEITLERARDKIFELAGGIGPPEWAGQGVGASAPAYASTYR